MAQAVECLLSKLNGWGAGDFLKTKYPMIAFKF
jgi:hypothetical protein